MVYKKNLLLGVPTNPTCTRSLINGRNQLIVMVFGSALFGQKNHIQIYTFFFHVHPYIDLQWTQPHSWNLILKFMNHIFFCNDVATTPPRCRFLREREKFFNVWKFGQSNKLKLKSNHRSSCVQHITLEN